MFAFFLFTVGLIIGSFLNVCIYRLPQEMSIVRPASHCFVCGARLRPQDLIPVVSYFLLKGRCRYCGTAFSPRYAVVELLTGGLFVVCFLINGLSAALLKSLIFSSFLVVITFIDIDHQLILDKVLLWLAGTGVVINVWLGSVGLLDMVIAALLGGALLLLIAAVSRGGMGGGDIKFAAALGLWFGWKLTVLTLFLSFFIGGIGGAVLLILKLKNRKDMIPFGPFIALGALVSLLYGDSIIRWYLNRFL